MAAAEHEEQHRWKKILWLLSRRSVRKDAHARLREAKSHVETREECCCWKWKKIKDEAGSGEEAARVLSARVISYCPIHIQTHTRLISLSVEIIQEIVNINFKWISIDADTLSRLRADQVMSELRCVALFDKLQSKFSRICLKIYLNCCLSGRVQNTCGNVQI